MMMRLILMIERAGKYETKVRDSNGDKKAARMSTRHAQNYTSKYGQERGND